MQTSASVRALARPRACRAGRASRRRTCHSSQTCVDVLQLGPTAGNAKQTCVRTSACASRAHAARAGRRSRVSLQKRQPNVAERDRFPARICRTLASSAIALHSVVTGWHAPRGAVRCTPWAPSPFKVGSSAFPRLQACTARLNAQELKVPLCMLATECANTPPRSHVLPCKALASANSTTDMQAPSITNSHSAPRRTHTRSARQPPP